MNKKTAKKSKKTAENTKSSRQHPTFKEAFVTKREKVWNKKRARVKLHRSFKRSYREDYHRPLEAPGLVAHATSTLKIIFKKAIDKSTVLLYNSISLKKFDSYRTV